MSSSQIQQLDSHFDSKTANMASGFTPIKADVRSSAKTKDKPVLDGNLKFIGLENLLQLLSTLGESGILRLTSSYAEPALVYIINGDPINAASGSKTGLEALNALFGWTQGRFEFVRGPVQKEKVINKSCIGIILDALRMLDEGTIRKLGPVSYEKQPSVSATQGTVVPLVRGPLVNYSDIVDETVFKRGQNIITEGKFGNWVYSILDGVAEIVKDTPKGPVAMLRLGPGSFLGSIRFFADFSSRTASAIATSNVQVGVINLERLYAEVSVRSREFRVLAASMVAKLKHVTDQAACFYAGDYPHKGAIEDFTPIINQGQAEDQLYTITHGKALVVKSLHGNHIPLTMLSKGDFFGRIPFLAMGQEPENASIYGSKDLKITPVDSQRLEGEYENLPFTLKSMLENIATCVSVTSKVACKLYKPV